MAHTATKERRAAAPVDDGFYESVPGARKETSLTIYQQFEAELDQRADLISSMLPSTVPLARFKNTVIAAIRQDPDILTASIRSVMASVIRAAQDGLVPDGREGHIAVYKTNVAKRGQPECWEKRAQWNPMAHGLRKRLRELDGIIANAEVVHENDHFVWQQGDDPRIEHRPAQLGSSRGKMIGSYCIYKREDGTILHREVMDASQVEQTRQQSKAKDSLMWTKFSSEGYRKSVLRRGIKTVPVSDTMRDIIRRDDEDNFAFSNRVSSDVPIPPAAPALIPPAAPVVTSEPIFPEEPQREPEKELGAADAYADWLKDSYAELDACETGAAIEDLRERVLAELNADDVEDWKSACADKAAEIFAGGRKK